MFGFLRSAAPSKSYRQAYARCCSVQHAWYGVSSLPALSYEGVFLYQCAVDAGLCPGPPEQMPTCCRLRTYRGYQRHGDAAVAGFCASLGLLLAAIKLEDDIADDRSWPARMARAWLRRPMQRAEAYFAALDPEFRTRIDGFLAAHQELESNPAVPELDEYAVPTAKAFGYVFGLLGRQSASASGEALSEIGWHVGAAIIAFDSAVDWSRDRRRGRYNPLPGRFAIRQAYDVCLLHLVTAGWRCTENSNRGLQAAEVLRSVFDRVARRACQSAEPQAKQRRVGWLSTMHGAALARAGFCDCDCGGCDACDCPSACDHGGCGAADACCCACDPCPGPCHRNEAKTKAAAATDTAASAISPTSSSRLVGMSGMTTSALNPTGLVEIAGQRLPGRSEGEWIAAGVEILVVEENKFGVIVRAK